MAAGVRNVLNREDTSEKDVRKKSMVFNNKRNFKFVEEESEDSESDSGHNSIGANSDY